MLPLGAMVRVIVGVMDGAITVALAQLVCVDFDQFVMPVTSGTVVRLKDGNGVRMRGIVTVVKVWFPGPVSRGTEVALVDGDGGMGANVPLFTNRVVVEGVCVSSVPVRLLAVGPPTEVALVCGKGGVPEMLADVLIATVVSDVDVEYSVEFSTVKVVGSEWDAPCGLPDNVLLGAETVEVVAVSLLCGACVV